jgi:putative acetyltransferase
MKSIEGNFNKPEVNKLLISHFIELSSVSPADRGHVLDIPGLKNPSIKFWSLWENDQLIGCGALKFLDKEHGELKSIRVADSFRRKGNGFKVINHLINEAKELNIKKISLETGTGNFFTPARKLFDKCGFKVCEPFAHYKKDPNACYMSLLLSN